MKTVPRDNESVALHYPYIKEVVFTSEYKDGARFEKSFLKKWKSFVRSLRMHES